jgi:hypothetical protein
MQYKRFTTLTKEEPVGRLFGAPLTQKSYTKEMPAGRLFGGPLHQKSTPNISNVLSNFVGPTRIPISSSTWGRELTPRRIMSGRVSRPSSGPSPRSVTKSVIPAILGAPSAPISPASMGEGVSVVAPAPASGLGGGLGEIGGQLGGGLTNIGSSISKTATDYLPLAVKVVIVVIVVKIVLWLVRIGGRRR